MEPGRDESNPGWNGAGISPEFGREQLCSTGSRWWDLEMDSLLLTLVLPEGLQRAEGAGGSAAQGAAGVVAWGLWRGGLDVLLLNTN